MKHVTRFFLITLICPLLSVAMDEAPVSLGKELRDDCTEESGGSSSGELKEQHFKSVIDLTKRLEEAIKSKHDTLPGNTSDDDETGKQKRSCERLLGLTSELQSLLQDSHEESLRKDPLLTLLERASSGLEFVNEAISPQILDKRILGLVRALMPETSQATEESDEKDWTLL